MIAELAQDWRLRLAARRLKLGKVSRSDVKFLLEMPSADAPRLFGLLKSSKAQFHQDLFVLSELGFKRDGFFVDIGATDGVEGNNSYVLESQFGWRGILCEPAKVWQNWLTGNRKTFIDNRCVWSTTGKRILFNETAHAGYSTIDEFSTADQWDRSYGKKYEVETVSLNDLLSQHGAPAEFDYLSIDTEGSEFDILSAFDFSKYRIRVITCEHNFTPNREKIFDLLTSRGYMRKHQEISVVDDFYVLQAGSPRGVHLFSNRVSSQGS